MRMNWQDLCELESLVRIHMKYLELDMQREKELFENGIRDEKDRFYITEYEKFTDILERLIEDREYAMMYGD